MRKPNVRVEARRLPYNASRDAQYRNLVQLQRLFKRMCGKFRLMPTLREHQYFVRESDKRRRKEMQRRHLLLHPEREKKEFDE